MDISVFMVSAEIKMFWIPVMFVCLISGDCSFLQGKPVYTEAKCIEQLIPLAMSLQADVRVELFDGTCVAVQAV